MAPRWTYIDPAIAFNPVISFEVVIMALLGGAGTAVRAAARRGAAGAAVRSADCATFPNYFSILLGMVFMLIVYVLPRGVIGADRERQLQRGPAVRGRAAAARATARRLLEVPACARRSAAWSRSTTSALQRRARRDRRPDRPERLGQDHGAQPDLRRAARPTPARSAFAGATIAGMPRASHRAARHRAHLPAGARARLA